MLHWETVSPELKHVLIKLMSADELNAFRLVGGTALSLYWGHRLSVDIDFFTDAPYGSVDFENIDTYLKATFKYVQGDFGGNAGLGKSYIVGNDNKTAVKLDIYYSMDPFFEPADLIDNIRIATPAEIVAMKIDVVQRGGRKKDFWDLHEALNQYTVGQMIDLHKKRFEWTHDEPLIKKKLIDFTSADDDFEPVCLKNKQWVFIKEDIEAAVQFR